MTQSQAGYDPRTYWSKVAADIASRGDSNEIAGDDTPFYRHKRHVFVSRFLRSMPAAGKSVLEVGCGPGGNLRIIVDQHPARIVGCDISPKMIELASVSNKRLPIQYVEVDGRTLPFTDHAFDIIFTVTGLQHNHAETFDPLTKEICRVAGQSVYLFEETAPQTNSAYSFVNRSVNDYADCMSNCGFQL